MHSPASSATECASSSSGAELWLRRLALAAAALSAVWVASQRWAASMQPAWIRLRDDAYYYFVWAAHFAHGDGPCVTLGVPTSGVHWLWAWLLTAASWLIGDPDPLLLVEWARKMGLGLHALTTICVMGFAPKGWRLALGLLHLGNPFLLHEAQNGQATALACCLLAVLVRVATLQALGLWQLGLASCLVVLARSDLVFFVIAVAFARHGLRARSFGVCAVAISSLLVTNLAFTRSLTQDSTWPLPWLFWQRFQAQSQDLWAFGQKVWFQLRPCLLSWPFATVSVGLGALFAWAGLRQLCPVRWRLVPLALVGVGTLVGASDSEVALLAAILLALWPRGSGPVTRAATLQLGLLLAAGALAVTHYVLRLNAPPHYFAVFGVCGLLALAELVRSAPKAAGLAFVALAVWQAQAARTEPESFPAQVEMKAAALVLRELFPRPPGEAIGAFNSGVLTAFDRGKVVNLDGIVNSRAFSALRSGSLSAYLDEERVRLLVDWPGMFLRESTNPHASGRFFGPDFVAERDLEPLAIVDDPDHAGGWPGTDAVHILWRRGSGAKPSGLAVPRVVTEADGTSWIGWPGRFGEQLLVGPVAKPESRRKLGSGVDGVTSFFRLPRRGPEPVGVYVQGRPDPLLVY